ncbi:hypothetical protein C4J81_08755 [Deltaproteobacteria bacterium Smac51]|nr:hypothetical protein C4J81_08755 [Deltaproteobacteria bacterium Smac51]
MEKVRQDCSRRTDNLPEIQRFGCLDCSSQAGFIIMSVKPRLRPTILCPACGITVQLPAMECESCGVDLRTGMKLSGGNIFDFSKFGGWLKSAVQWAVFCFIVVQIYGYVTAGDEPVMVLSPKNQMKVTEIMPQEIKDSVPDKLRQLAEEHPILLQPYILMYEAQEVIRLMNEGSLRRDNVMGSASEVFSESGQDSTHYVKTTPAMRYHILEELDREVQNDNSR